MNNIMKQIQDAIARMRKSFSPILNREGGYIKHFILKDGPKKTREDIQEGGVATKEQTDKYLDLVDNIRDDYGVK